MATAAAIEENKAIVRRFADEFVNEGNYETIDEFLTEDVADHTPFGTTTGREAVLETTKAVRTAFPDFVVTPEAVIAEGDTVAVRMTQRGTHGGEFMGMEPTEKSFEIEAMAFLRLDDGKIAERWVRPDLLGMLRQLGIEDVPVA